MKKKKILIVIFLIVLMVIVWYINLHFIKKIQPQNAMITTPHRDVSSIVDSLPTFNFEYTDLPRDPFRIPVDTSSTAPRTYTPPKLSLRGVVLAKDGAIALIELSDGRVYTMKQGDKYMGVKVKKITPKSVVIDYYGREQTLNVWE